MLNRMLLAALIATPSILHADVASAPAPSAKEMKEVVDDVNYVETAQKGIVLSGYVDAGYTFNFIGEDTGSAFTSRVPSDAAAGGAFHLNALKLVLEKPLTDANEWQAGFRTDLFLGEDAANAGQNNGAFGGSGSDSLYLHQAFVQFRVPVGNGLDIQVGKFSTTLGFELIERPANMNITYGILYQNAVPLWHVGTLASYEFCDAVTAKFGVVNGANVDAFNQSNSDPSFLAGLGLNAPGGNASIGNNVYLSPNSTNDAPTLGVGTNGTEIIYDMIGTWAPKFANDKLLFGYELNIGNAGGSGGTGADTWWGAALYAKYQFTDVFSLAGRGEYFHDSNGTKLAFNNPVYAGSSADIWSWTLTAGFDIIENFMFRTEYRLDYGDDVVAGSAGVEDIGHTVSAQVVYSF